MKTTFYFSRSHMKSFRPKRENGEAFGTKSVRSLSLPTENLFLPSDQGVGELIWAAGNKAIVVIRLWIVMSLLHALALIARGAEHQIVLQTGHGFLYSLDFSPDGRTLVSGGGMHNSFSSASAESTVKLWDVSTGLLTQNLFGHQATVRCVRYSPDGRTIASLDRAGVVKLWHVEDGKAFQTINGYEDSSMLAFSSDSKRLALNLKERVSFWDIATAQVHSTLLYSNKTVATFTLSKDTSLIAAVCQSSSANGPQRSQSEVQIRETESGRILRNWGPRFAMESDEGVDRIGIVDQLALAFDPLSDLLVSSAKHSLLTWNTRTGKENSQLFDMAQQHQEVAISPKAPILASADGGDNPTIAYRTLRLWDLKQGKVIKRISGVFAACPA
jgi:WD40 repeat protein